MKYLNFFLIFSPDRVTCHACHHHLLLIHYRTKVFPTVICLYQSNAGVTHRRVGCVNGREQKYGQFIMDSPSGDSEAEAPDRNRCSEHFPSPCPLTTPHSFALNMQSLEMRRIIFMGRSLPTSMCRPTCSDDKLVTVHCKVGESTQMCRYLM